MACETKAELSATPDAGPVGEVLIETVGTEETQAALARAYGSLRVRARDPHGRMRLHQAPLGPSRLDRVRFDMTFDCAITAPENFFVGLVHAGHLTFRYGRREQLIGPGDVYLAPQPGASYRSKVVDASVELVSFDSAALASVSEPPPARKPRPVRFNGYEPVSADAAVMWKAAQKFVRDTVLVNPLARHEALVVGAAARMLAATALVVFPNDALSDPTAMDRRDATPAAVRRATAFIDEHAHQDLSAADVAAAAQVSIRAVQVAFRRHLGVTPMDYLRRVRVERAHGELLAAQPGQVTVAEVAFRWGFTSPSRFAQYYRRCFGVAPSQTLRS